VIARAVQAIVLGACLCAAYAWAGQDSFSQIDRGKYLTAAGGCRGCHTASDGTDFAGGRGLETPFGTIYSANITPDEETGIGTWTEDQFYRAMHEGIDNEGKHLYPAFPYPNFARATREDVDSIRAYLRTLPAVRARAPKNDLPWPFNHRGLIGVWNAMFFDDAPFKADPSKPEQWNRGAYLVEGLGHCGACHSPKNFAGAVKSSKRFMGGELSHWFSPSLTRDSHEGLGSWSEGDIVTFLATGRTDHAVAHGPMAEVVHNTTSQLSKEDLQAIAVFLKSLPGEGSDRAGGAATMVKSAPEDAGHPAGHAIYVDTCSACHQGDGSGVSKMFPRLAGDPAIQSDNATTVVRLILNGGRAVSTRENPTPVSMPAFGWKLSDAQVADVANYVRNAWGNEAGKVSARDVRKIRSRVETSTE
jgi:mono/diheme cytochrome c family protein